MPFTAADIIAVPGAVDANSYVTVAEFTSASESEQVSTVVEDAISDDVARALVSAAEGLDDEHYIGQRASSTQRLAWPRVSATDVYGYTYDSDEIPRRLKRAQVLYARHLLEQTAANAGIDPTVPDDDRRVKRVKAGEVDIEFNAPLVGNASAATPFGSMLPDAVLRALSGIVLTPEEAAALLRGLNGGIFAWTR